VKIVPNQDSENLGTEIEVGSISEFNSMFQNHSSELSNFYSDYSIEDIAASIFISSIWLPNIASIISHVYFTYILVSKSKESFKQENQIKSYGDFKSFIENLYTLNFDFSVVQDYIPDIDWGDVKFPLNNKLYSGFYGTDLGAVYDLVSAFKMIHFPLEHIYIDKISLSPSKELADCLGIQDKIISSIVKQPSLEVLEEKISPGYLTTPSEEFWSECQAFIQDLNDNDALDVDFVNKNEIKFEERSLKSLKYVKFSEKAVRGKILKGYFILINNKVFPSNPRRYFSVLLDRWNQNYNSVQKYIKFNLSTIIGDLFFSYLTDRIRLSSATEVYRNGCALDKRDRPHNLIYPIVLVNQTKLVLFYILPKTDSFRYQNKLNLILDSLNNSVKLIRENGKVYFPSLKGGIGAADNISFEVELLTVIPTLELDHIGFKVPESFLGSIIPLSILLGVIDEIKGVDDLLGFLKFNTNFGTKIHNLFCSSLERWGLYKDSHGVPIEGANDVDVMYIDPHYGSNIRFSTLKDFWSAYPPYVVKGIDPRSWEATKLSNMSSRMVLKKSFPPIWFTYSVLNKSSVNLFSPTHPLTEEQVYTTALLMDVFQDALELYRPELEQLTIFNSSTNFAIKFYPFSICKNIPELAKILPLEFSESKRFTIIRDSRSENPSFNLIYHEEMIHNAFVGADKRELEIDYITSVLLNLFGDSELMDLDQSIFEGLNKYRDLPPRFRRTEIQKRTAFPENISVMEPDEFHYKTVRKQIALYAKDLNIEPGYYEKNKAVKILNVLKTAILSKVSDLVGEFNFEHSFPFILTRLGAVAHDRERMHIQLNSTVNQHIDYSREQEFAKSENKYIELHNEYRYLLEKFVHIQPTGKKILEADDFKLLAAYSNWLLTFYNVSDQLYYETAVVGVTVREDFRLDIKYNDDSSRINKDYSEIIAQIKMNLVVGSEDSVENPLDKDEVIDLLDDAFLADLNFKFSHMIQILGLLNNIPGYVEGLKERIYYSLKLEEIRDICVQEIDGVSEKEINSIIDFLTLKQNDVIRLLDEEGNILKEEQLDIPVWEYKKRFSRYNIRPLIFYNNKYYWEAYGARNAGVIWSGAPTSSGFLPAELKKDAISKVLDVFKDKIERAVEQKSKEVLERFTQFVETDVFLHKYDVKGSHPKELGDYDVLGYIQSKNILVNIECKDHFPPFCMKDGKRLQRKVYGKENISGQGELGKVEKRHNYLVENMPKIISLFSQKKYSWPLDAENYPKVVSFYVSRHLYPWTYSPLRKTWVTFLQTEQLHGQLLSI
jgi:hypothetical protein